jgi:hypothetical protein
MFSLGIQMPAPSRTARRSLARRTRRPCVPEPAAGICIRPRDGRLTRVSSLKRRNFWLQTIGGPAANIQAAGNVSFGSTSPRERPWTTKETPGQLLRISDETAAEIRLGEIAGFRCVRLALAAA